MTDVTLLDQHVYLKVKLSKGKGRGVFARKDIAKGTVFLVDPIVLVPKDEMSNYIFEHDDKTFIAMGIGSLINHSAQQNCFWIANVKGKSPTISFKTDKKVKAGEELLHDYLWDTYPEGFDY